jgi:hypothetical protein
MPQQRAEVEEGGDFAERARPGFDVLNGHFGHLFRY